MSHGGGGNKTQPSIATCNQLAGPALHVAFRKQELNPVGKAEVDSLSRFAQGKWLLTPSVVRLEGNSSMRRDLVQALSWHLGGIQETTKSGEQHCYEFMMVDVFLWAVIPEERKLVHQLYSEGRLKKALNKYKLGNCKIMIFDDREFPTKHRLLNFNWNCCSSISK